MERTKVIKLKKGFYFKKDFVNMPKEFIIYIEKGFLFVMPIGTKRSLKKEKK